MHRVGDTQDLDLVGSAAGNIKPIPRTHFSFDLNQCVQFNTKGTYFQLILGCYTPSTLKNTKVYFVHFLFPDVAKMGCYLGKSVGTHTHDIFSFLFG